MKSPGRCAVPSWWPSRASPRLGPTPRVAASCPTPPGPEGSKGKRALSGARGAFSCPDVARRVVGLRRPGPARSRAARPGVRARPASPAARLPGVGAVVRVQAWSHPSRCTAATGPRPSPRSSGRTTSPSRCGPRWRTTGSTTPTSSPARAAAARPPAPGSWPGRSTASRRPIADPCGECDSCRDLARGGPGSIDVIEIDAASHGGVDDARDLREKAFFAPVRSRYKVYIIDEAHMVTTQGFNALLKLVEEPPPHLRFIFATTEPDKVIPTIRSRTHHYPFRLIPPRLLSSYLSELCEKEGVAIEPAALPLVVRAGAGSARDTLSVLDQLLGGAGPDGVTYDAGDRAARLHPRHPARRGRRRVRGRRRRGRLRGRRQGDRDRPGPAPLHRGPAAPAARPGDRRRRARRARPPG